MALYTAYFDESGTSDSPFVTVAGCIAELDQWKHFEREWLLTLKPLGISIFHANDFQARKPPYDLPAPEREELFCRLVGIICRRVETTFSRTIRMAEYRAINRKYLFAESYGYPYPSAARACMSLVFNWADRHSISQRPLIVFEDGALHKGQIEWIAERDRIEPPTFRPKFLVPLQAGDLLSWSHNLYLTTGRRMEPLYERCLDRLSLAGGDWAIINLEDSDRVPALLDIPLRDPNMRYKCKIIRKNSKRVALIHYWPKSAHVEPRTDKRRIVVPDKPPLSLEEAEIRIARYDALKKGIRSA
jgi:hypothetical protein